MSEGVLDPAAATPAIDRGGRYSASLRSLAGVKASGVYAIITGKTVRYVGESHTGRLYDTITRHFRSWRPEHDPQGRRRGGVEYDRSRARVVYIITEPDVAQVLQYAEIDRLSPPDNTLAGERVDGIDQEIPVNPPQPSAQERRGRRAIVRCLLSRGDVPNAMTRPALGAIEFRYDRLMHILDRRRAERDAALGIITIIPRVIARGRVTFRGTEKAQSREALCRLGPIEVVCSLWTGAHPSRRRATWLVTAYRIKK